MKKPNNINLKGIICGATSFCTIDAWQKCRASEKQLSLDHRLLDKIDEITSDQKNLVNASLNKEAKVNAFMANLKESQFHIDNLQNKHSYLKSQLDNAKINLEEKSKILEAIRQNQEEKANLAETILSQSKNFETEYVRLGFWDDFKEKFSEWLSTLNGEQLACLANIIGIIWITIIINGIIFTYYGNKIINNWSLETRFPSLAHIVKLRMKISNKMILFEIIYLYLVILVFLILDTTMFITSYFNW